MEDGDAYQQVIAVSGVISDLNDNIGVPKKMLSNILPPMHTNILPMQLANGYATANNLPSRCGPVSTKISK